VSIFLPDNVLSTFEIEILTMNKVKVKLYP
jgi:hypothetical protein